MVQPIINPPLPFIGPIEGGFTPGKMIRIQGVAPPSGDRFDINLQCGDGIDPRSDIALHLSVRILEGYIPRNSFRDNMWADEEAEGSCPIGAGERFEIIILSDDGQYKIAVNGQHYAEFRHRIPNHAVSHLDIEGPVQITLISFEGNEPTHFTQNAVSNDAMQYGPPPQQQQQFGPPPGPQGGYYPSGPYGPSPYGPPAPPGYQEESGFESFLGSAGSAIAGVLSAGVADKLLGSLTGSQNQPQQQAPPPPQPAPQPTLPQLGGQGSIGGLGTVGSLLSSLASEVLSPSTKRQGNY